MDPELERLVADMSVAQTPEPHRDGGGLERGNEPGMLDDDSRGASMVQLVTWYGDHVRGPWFDARRSPPLKSLLPGFRM
jgi:hypothetical protein